MRLPEIVIHSDWGTEPKKRWSVHARLDGCRYVLGMPEKFDARSFPNAMLHPTGATLLGVDFAIGVPIEYAKAAGMTDFLGMVRDASTELFDSVATLDELSPKRPFLGTMPRGSTEIAVLERIGLTRASQLRRCERAPMAGYRGAACCMFLPKPIKQVAGATRTGWRDLLQPGLMSSAGTEGRFKVWPFDGELDELVRPGTVTIAETYPAEFYARLGLVGNSKRVPMWRRDQGERLVEVARELEVRLPDDLRGDILSGFGEVASGEDRFDALVGVLGMLRVVLGHGPCDAPQDDEVRKVEGWIMARPVESSSADGHRLVQG